jgi:hypothetical protein
LKISLPPVLKAGSSGIQIMSKANKMKSLMTHGTLLNLVENLSKN